MFVLYAQRNVKRPDRRATRRHHRVIVCIICARERQKTGSSRNKTPPSRYCLYHMRNGTSKDRIVTQQDATSCSTDLQDPSIDHTIRTVPILTRSLESTRSDGYRTVKILESSQDRMVIGRLIKQVIARSDGYRTVKILSHRKIGRLSDSEGPSHRTILGIAQSHGHTRSLSDRNIRTVRSYAI